MRTEEEVLKDFGKLGYKVITINEKTLVLCNKKGYTRIFI